MYRGHMYVSLGNDNFTFIYMQDLLKLYLLIFLSLEMNAGFKESIYMISAYVVPSSEWSNCENTYENTTDVIRIWFNAVPMKKNGWLESNDTGSFFNLHNFQKYLYQISIFF